MRILRSLVYVRQQHNSYGLSIDRIPPKYLLSDSINSVEKIGSYPMTPTKK